MKKHEFEIGEIVWDSENYSYGVVLNNYPDDFIEEIRIDSDGNRPIEFLHKLGSKGDKGTKAALIQCLISHKTLVTRYGYSPVNY